MSDNRHTTIRAAGNSLESLAKHVVNQKMAEFEPEKFEDHYEEALTELINAKRQGKAIVPKPRPSGENVVDLMGRAEAQYCQQRYSAADER